MEQQPGMTLILLILLICCGIALLSWIGLIVYRSFLESREDDQIFLDKAEESLARQQRELVARINKVNPLIRNTLILWIALAVISAAVWVYQGLKSF